MKIASLPAPPTAATQNDRRISFIPNATAATHTWATPQNGSAARRSNRHDARSSEKPLLSDAPVRYSSGL